MNKDRVEGKVKDIAGKAQRKAGEWADDPEQEAKGAAKQVEGKVQNAWGQAKDATKDRGKSKPPRNMPEESEDEQERRRA